MTYEKSNYYVDPRFWSTELDYFDIVKTVIENEVAMLNIQMGIELGDNKRFSVQIKRTEDSINDGVMMCDIYLGITKGPNSTELLVHSDPISVMMTQKVRNQSVNGQVKLMCDSRTRHLVVYGTTDGKYIMSSFDTNPIFKIRISLSNYIRDEYINMLTFLESGKK